jgi:hypothetical protein
VIVVDHQCSAIARALADDFGWKYIQCDVRLGLRSFTDRRGIVRYYCPSEAHKRSVQRRFGRSEACYLCGRDTDDMAISVHLGVERLGLMCWACQDDLADA